MSNVSITHLYIIYNENYASLVKKNKQILLPDFYFYD